MANSETRRSLYTEINKSKYMENKVDLNELSITLSCSLSSLSLNSRMKMALDNLSIQTKYFEENNIVIDVYFPVKEHRKAFLNNPNVDLLVAYDPIDEHAQIIAFYSNGSKIYLSPEKPPNIPTLIVTISESRFKKSSYTIFVKTCDLDSTYMKYIKANEISEPWFKGDPEIYCWIVYENGLKKKLFWKKEITREKTYCYLGCERPIIDQWRKDEFEHVAFIWYEQDVSFPIRFVKVRLPWSPVEIEIGDIIIDRDEMGMEIADWDAVPCSPHDSGKLYNTGCVEFRITGKSGCLLKTTPTPTQTPKMIPILDISAPEFAYVGEGIEISVHSNCYMTDGQPLICTYTYNPISDATITIKKDGVIVKTGKTDENGIFRTVFSETGEYTITASKDGYISATTEIKVLEYIVTVTPESSVKVVTTNYSS